jgi:hypothetical protein
MYVVAYGTKLRMSENLEKIYRGFWWEPSNPDVQWYGKVRWRPRKSPCLKLRYKTAECSSHPPPSNVESILGRDASGKPITLLRLGCSRRVLPGFLSTNTYHAGHLLRGLHVARLADLRVHRIEYWMQNLGAWIGDEGLTTEVSRDAERSEYRRPEDREYRLTRNLMLKVCHAGGISYKARQHTLGYDIYFAIERRQGANFNQAFRWINAMVNLIHFASLKKVRLTAIKFQEATTLGGSSGQRTVEVYNAAWADS